MTHTEDIEAVQASSRRPRAWLCMALAIAATVTFTALASTVAGTSGLAESAESGDSAAILITTLGYAFGVLSALMALLLCLKPVIENRSRQLALTAGIIAVLSPLAAASLASAIGLR
ncbi:hypothetical protein [Leucobacter sp. L43]|uniref:hypothetical protein n=1 Tax=Leucobacter sp. L43 TaxID=2798040 RepID=UPI0019074AE0|nr:hypothetical protein [Leucobacter sp. L43]